MSSGIRPDANTAAHVDGFVAIFSLVRQIVNVIMVNAIVTDEIEIIAAFYRDSDCSLTWYLLIGDFIVVDAVVLGFVDVNASAREVVYRVAVCGENRRWDGNAPLSVNSNPSSTP